MIEKIAGLKPCPICWSNVRVDEFMVIPCGTWSEFSATISCRCGLTFKHEWRQGNGVILDKDIITLWNNWGVRKDVN